MAQAGSFLQARAHARVLEWGCGHFPRRPGKEGGRVPYPGFSQPSLHSLCDVREEAGTPARSPVLPLLRLFLQTVWLWFLLPVGPRVWSPMMPNTGWEGGILLLAFLGEQESDSGQCGQRVSYVPRSGKVRAGLAYLFHTWAAGKLPQRMASSLFPSVRLLALPRGVLGLGSSSMFLHLPQTSVLGNDS